MSRRLRGLLIAQAATAKAIYGRDPKDWPSLLAEDHSTFNLQHSTNESHS